jgi:hypothetical protein
VIDFRLAALFAAVERGENCSLQQIVHALSRSLASGEDGTALSISRTQAVHLQPFRKLANHWHRRPALARLGIGFATIPD